MALFFVAYTTVLVETEVLFCKDR